MEKKKVLSEEISYVNGNRKSVATIETITTLADDRMILANYYNTLASLEATIQNLINNMPVDPIQKHLTQIEIDRLRSEMSVISAAIEVQQGYIKGYEQHEV